MITKFKIYESLETEQQPFFLNKSDFLYISDDFAKKIAPKFKNRKGKYNEWYVKKELENQVAFFGNIKNEKGYNKVNRISLDIKVEWGEYYSMSLSLYRGNERNIKQGIFHYYITGNSGDHDMHGKNMVRGTRDSNLNFMIKFYPIVKHIKNFYKRFKMGEEGFLEIIRKELDKNQMLALYGVPKELKKEEKYKYMEDYIKNSLKYNL